MGTRRREDDENSDRDWMESARADTTRQEERERAKERELKRGTLREHCLCSALVSRLDVRILIEIDQFGQSETDVIWALDE